MVDMQKKKDLAEKALFACTQSLKQHREEGRRRKRRTWQRQAARPEMLPHIIAASVSYLGFIVDISQFASFSFRATYLENGSLGV